MEENLKMRLTRCLKPLVLCSVFVLLPASAWADPKAKDVTVVNEAGDPVPVTIVDGETTVVIEPGHDPLPVVIEDPPQRTHMGQPVREHIVLTLVAPGAGEPTVCDEPNQEFREIFSSGDLASGAFVVPDGKIFVATDLDAVIPAGTGDTFRAGSTVHAVLNMENNVGSTLVPHSTSGVPITTAVQEAVSVNSNLGAGVLIGAGQQVCVRGDERTGTSGYIFHRVSSASVRGYLIDAP